MSIQQNIASDAYRMANLARTPEQIQALQHSLTQSIKNGALPSYVGIPIIQDLNQRLKQESQPQQASAPPVAQQVLQQAQQSPQAAPQTPPQGIASVPSNLPTESMNDGGIVAFADDGLVEGEETTEEDRQDQIDEAEYGDAVGQLIQQQQIARRNQLNRPLNVNKTPEIKPEFKLSQEAQEAGLSLGQNPNIRPEDRAAALSGKGIASLPQAENKKESSRNTEGGVESISSSKSFYNNMYQTLKNKAEEMGFKNPEAIARVGAAQSALETGYGKSLAGGNNFFGIKGTGGNKQQTQEYDPATGRMYDTSESFRTYANMGDSAADYLRLMQNPRYQKVAMAQSPEEAIRHQAQSGYATDPEYGSKLSSIYRAHLANGGIAHLAGGGIPRFGKGRLVDSTGASPEAPEDIYPEESPDRSGLELTNPFSSARYLNPNSLPRVTDAERSRYIQHGLNFGPEGAGTSSDRSNMLLPPGVTLPNTPVVTNNTPTPSPNPASYEGNNQPFRPTETASSPSIPVSGVDTLLPPAGRKSQYDELIDSMRQEKLDSKKQKEEDKYMALISAGLGMMSGTSPNAFANIGQGAQQGVASYAASNKQRAAENAALNKNIAAAHHYRSMENVGLSRQDLLEREHAANLDYKKIASAENLDLKTTNWLQGSYNHDQTTYAKLMEKFGGINGVTAKAADPAGYERAIKTMEALEAKMNLTQRALDKRMRDANPELVQSLQPSGDRNPITSFDRR